MKFIISLIFICFTIQLSAQVTFEFQNDIEVIQDGNSLNRAFEGGLNSAQYQTLDLNQDGQLDLVVFHRISRSITTYIRNENTWVFSPIYASQFPEDIVNWLVAKDFDCDGDKDLFTSTTLGIKVYRNISTSDQLNWEVASEFLTIDSGTNIQVSPTDIPGFADVNGDGALDILTYRFGSSGSVDYLENSGSCGELTFTRVTRTWGEFYDCGCNDFSFGQPCSSSGEIEMRINGTLETKGTLHAGGKTILPFDADNDGDIDIITSDELCSIVAFMENIGTPDQALMTSFSPYPTNEPVEFNFFPSAFLEDIDFDGLNDLIISTNLDNNSADIADLENHTKVYSNLGSNEVPTFYNSMPFLQNQMLDVGENAFPEFHDYDEDGDEDLFISTKGRINDYGSIWLFENTGNRFNPQFELVDDDFAGLKALDFTAIKTRFADLDNDGIIDLIFQARVGPLDNRVFFKKGIDREQFEDRQDLQLDVTEASNPLIFDLNRDGLSDILIGQQFGSLTYYRNQGALSFAEENNFGGIEGDFNRQNLSIAIADYGNGIEQIITLESQGRLRLYQGIANQNWTISPFREDIITFEDELSSLDLGRSNFLATADLFGEGKSSLVIGSSKGGLYFLRNISEIEGENELSVSISPNPTLGNVRVLINSNAIGEIIDLNGKLIENGIDFENSVIRELNFSELTQGIYLLRLQSSDGRTAVRKIIIQP